MLKTHPTPGPSPKAPLLHAGEIRRFGPYGVLYEILTVPYSGDKTVIGVLDTNEELTYAISKTLADPVD